MNNSKEFCAFHLHFQDSLTIWNSNIERNKMNSIFGHLFTLQIIIMIIPYAHIYSLVFLNSIQYICAGKAAKAVKFAEPFIHSVHLMSYIFRLEIVYVTKLRWIIFKYHIWCVKCGIIYAKIYNSKLACTKNTTPYYMVNLTIMLMFYTWHVGAVHLNCRTEHFFEILMRIEWVMRAYP